MTKYLFVAAALYLLGGCTEKFDPSDAGSEYPIRPAGTTQSVHVSLPLISAGQSGATARAVAESAIRDVNLYLYGPSGVVHTYCEGAEPRFDCLPGDYRLYALANLHVDAGAMTEGQLAAFALTDRADDDDLPMTAFVERVTVPPASAAVRLPAVTVVRAVARIDYDITVRTLANLEIRSVQVMSVPQQYLPFTTEDAPMDYADSEPAMNTSSGRRMRGTFYMLPNERGTVAGIADQRQKNAANAPAHATWLRIRARHGSKVLDYCVYLGQNNTSDFNIRPNTAHTLHIRLRDDKEADARIRNYTVEVAAEADIQPQDGFCLEPLSASWLNIRLSGDYADMGLNGFVTLLEGDRQEFLFNGRILAAPRKFSLHRDVNSVSVAYAPSSFTPDNATLRYRLTICDKYGEVESYEYTYRFARRLQVYLTWAGGTRLLSGTIDAPGALGVVFHDTLSAAYAAVYCTDEGCRVFGVPENGKRVECWASDHNHVGILSYAAYYDFVPGTSPSTVFLFFI